MRRAVVLLLALAACGRHAPKEKSEKKDASRDSQEVSGEVAVGTPDAELPPAPPIPETVKNPDPVVATPEEWEALTRKDETEALLREGNILWAKVKVKVRTYPWLSADAKRIIFMGTVRKGEASMPVQIKVPEQIHQEWKGEILAYRVAKKLGLLVPPAVFRPFNPGDFKRIHFPAGGEDMALVKWEPSGACGIPGSVRYWVENLNPRVIGGKVADEAYLEAVAAALHPGNLKELVDHHPLLLEMGRGFVFDYLVYNNDRPRNLGTLVLADGTEKLVLFDHGLAMGPDMGFTKRSQVCFGAMQMLPGDVVQILASMTEEDLGALLDPGECRKLKVTDLVFSQIWERRGRIIEKAEELKAKYGPAALY